MKHTDLGFKSDSPKNGMYVYRTALDAMGYTLTHLYSGERKVIGDTMRKHLRSAKDTEQFIDLIIRDKTLSGTVLHSVLIMYERPEMLRDALVEMFSKVKCFAATSDAGSVRVGNDLFSALIPNGIGDGDIYCGIFPKESDFNSTLMGNRVVSEVNGTANIYDYDCDGGSIAATISGRFLVFSQSGFVAFREI